MQTEPRNAEDTRHVWDRAPPLQRCDCADRHSVDGNNYVAEGNENYPPRSPRFKISTMRQHLWARVRAISRRRERKTTKNPRATKHRTPSLEVKESGTDPGTMTDDQIDAEFRKESHNDEMEFRRNPNATPRRTTRCTADEQESEDSNCIQELRTAQTCSLSCKQKLCSSITVAEHSVKRRPCRFTRRNARLAAAGSPQSCLILLCWGHDLSHSLT